MSEPALKRRKSQDIDISDENTAYLNPDREIVWRSCCFCLTQFLLLIFTRRPSQKRRWFLAFLFFFSSSFLMCVANVFTERRAVDKKLPSFVLPDYGFDFADKFTPFLADYKTLPDIGQYVVVILSIIWLISDCKQPVIVFRRFLMIHSLLFLCRAFCLLGTQLPNPYTGYPTGHKYEGNIFYEALLVGCRYKITRTDVFYSGHTVSMTCMSLMIEYYHSNTIFQKIYSTIVWIITLFTLYMIVAVKFHYTIDVVVAFQLTIVTWKLYHMATESHLLRKSIPILDFFEGDVVEENNYSDTLPEQLEKTLIGKKKNT